MRNRSLGYSVHESRFNRASRDLQTTNPCTVAFKQRSQSVTCGSYSRVACKGQLGVYHEDAGAPGWDRHLVSFGVAVIVQVQESGLGEVELARDGLQGFGRGVLACWDED
jgi:hypothetical protein